jgi:hypothetical protein
MKLIQSLSRLFKSNRVLPSRQEIESVPDVSFESDKSNRVLPNRQQVEFVPDISSEPDFPISFGYKAGWFAVRSDDAALVGRVLGLADAHVANWRTGLDAVWHAGSSAVWSSKSIGEIQKYRVFITPPLDGWVLVVSNNLPYPVKSEGASLELAHLARRFEELLSRLASHFDNVQYFASHRVSDFVTWTLLTERTFRSFTWGGAWVYINRGMQTKAEMDLGFPNLTGLDCQIATNEIFRLLGESQDAPAETSSTSVDVGGVKRNSPMPSEVDVTDLAARWSIDPTCIQENFQEKSTGLLGWLIVP